MESARYFFRRRTGRGNRAMARLLVPRSSVHRFLAPTWSPDNVPGDRAVADGNRRGTLSGP